MKLLSVVVPSYNSQAYMYHCIDKLLAGGSDVEILIVDDGSADDTAAIADSYEARFPDMVRAIHQENSGHGGAVNTGIANASGMYLKVVDSDDWVNGEAYAKVMTALRSFAESDRPADLLVSNFVYEKNGKKYKKVMRYGNVFPENTVFTWDQVGRFRNGQYLLMHSVIYRTALLRDSGLQLPKHTFYVDNLYVYVPLKDVKTLYYLNVDFYRYYIGRDNQSVNESVMIRRIDQQIRVNKLMLQQVNLQKVENLRLRKYLLYYFDVVTMVSTVLLVRSGTAENLAKKDELWAYIRECDPWVHNRIRRSLIGLLLNLPGRIGRDVTVTGYKVAQRIVGFN